MTSHPTVRSFARHEYLSRNDATTRLFSVSKPDGPDVFKRWRQDAVSSPMSICPVNGAIRVGPLIRRSDARLLP